MTSPMQPDTTAEEVVPREPTPLELALAAATKQRDVATKDIDRLTTERKKVNERMSKARAELEEAERVIRALTPKAKPEESAAPAKRLRSLRDVQTHKAEEAAK